METKRYQVSRLEFEMTAYCDHRCAHCYNIWADDETKKRYQQNRLDTPTYLQMMESVIKQSGATGVTLTGGEPLLRPNTEKNCAEGLSSQFLCPVDHQR